MPRLKAPRSAFRRRLHRYAPLLRRVVIGAGCLAVLGGGAYAWRSQGAAALGSRLADGALALTATAGFSVQEVMVTGRVHTDADAILQALGLHRGDPILAFDPAAARTALEALPWVDRARVERRLPDAIHVALEERQPLALWQHDQQLRLIDQDGKVLQEDRLADFASLPMIVGADAPENASALLLQLQAVPAVAERVQAAVRVGGRRWDLRLDNGVNVRLPENDMGRALARLARLQTADGLFDRDVLTIDMRLSDRMIVQTSPIAAERRRLPQENT